MNDHDRDDAGGSVTSDDLFAAWDELDDLDSIGALDTFDTAEPTAAEPQGPTADDVPAQDQAALAGENDPSVPDATEPDAAPAAHEPTPDDVTSTDTGEPAGPGTEASADLPDDDFPDDLPDTLDELPADGSDAAATTDVADPAPDDGNDEGTGDAEDVHVNIVAGDPVAVSAAAPEPAPAEPATPEPAAALPPAPADSSRWEDPHPLPPMSDLDDDDVSDMTFTLRFDTGTVEGPTDPTSRTPEAPADPAPTDLPPAPPPASAAAAPADPAPEPQPPVPGAPPTSRPTTSGSDQDTEDAESAAPRPASGPPAPTSAGARMPDPSDVPNADPRSSTPEPPTSGPAAAEPEPADPPQGPQQPLGDFEAAPPAARQAEPPPRPTAQTFDPFDDTDVLFSGVDEADSEPPVFQVEASEPQDTFAFTLNADQPGTQQADEPTADRPPATPPAALDRAQGTTPAPAAPAAEGGPNVGSSVWAASDDEPDTWSPTWDPAPAASTAQTDRHWDVPDSQQVEEPAAWSSAPGPVDDPAVPSPQHAASQPPRESGSAPTSGTPTAPGVRMDASFADEFAFDTEPPAPEPPQGETAPYTVRATDLDHAPTEPATTVEPEPDSVFADVADDDSAHDPIGHAAAEWADPTAPPEPTPPAAPSAPATPEAPATVQPDQAVPRTALPPTSAPTGTSDVLESTYAQLAVAVNGLRVAAEQAGSGPQYNQLAEIAQVIVAAQDMIARTSRGDTDAHDDESRGLLRRLRGR